MFVFVSFLSIFSAPCAHWHRSQDFCDTCCTPTHSKHFEATILQTFGLKQKLVFRHFGLKAIVVSKHFGFEPRLLFRHFCFEAALLFKHFGWKPLQAKTFFKHFSFERFYSILCFNATLYCSNMFQATIFFKYVGGLKFGFRSKTFFRLLVSKQTFFKKFWEKTKVCSEFFFAWLAALQVSKQFWQTFCSVIINAREKNWRECLTFE